MWFILICLSLSSTIARVQLSSEQRDFTCKANQIQCGDGTCIPFGGKCDDRSTQLHKTRERRDMTLEPKSVCVLPPYPEHGTYKVANVEDAQPGQTFGSVVLTVGCRRGYGVATTDDEGSEMAKRVYCVNGLWLQPIPKCVRFCKVNPDPSIRFMCLVPGAGFKACPTYVQPGTSAKPICNNLYQSSDELGYITCRFGFWDNIPHCKAECGLITPEGEQLIIDGIPVKRGELPWHVGIYRKTTEPYEQICGGSLVSNNVVLSAAHCFWHDVEKLLPSSNYAVAIGKLHRSWNSENDIAWQESYVKEIIIPDLFKGESTNVQDDIAVVILLIPFIYKTYVKPVCLSFEANFDTYQLQPGKSGKVAGWGLTKVDGTPSAILKFVNMPYINTDICIDTVPPAFTRFITSDKFCAGYTNGTALCKGDSGGGLAFAEREQGQLRYYLRGIVSTAPRSDNHECNNSTYITFTKIRKHEDFIKKSLAASVNKTCPWYLFQCNDGACIDQGADCNGKEDCADGSDESEELCSPEADSIDGPACILPNPPNFGEYRIENSSSIPTPGRRFKSVAIHIQCHRWYTIVSADGRTTGIVTVACVNGKWSDTMPECLDYCSVDSDPSVRYKCRHPINNKIMVCNKYKKPDLPCIPQTNYHVRPDPEIKCASNSSGGDGVVLCKEDCGRVTVRKVQAKTGGKQVTRKYMPWHVSIYEKNGNEFLYYCGGTMISNNVIISAADRFWDEEKGYIRLSEWGAAAGQIYRLWDDERNVNAQKSDVKAITVPDTYVGKSQGYKYDVAVLVLLDSFIFNTYVKHVCLDWEPELDTQQLQEDNVGKIAGWGRADDNSAITQQIIKVTNVVDYVCEYLPWAQLGQTCSKYKDKDLQFLNSNIGSGLVFAHNDSGVERYYLRGVLTAKCLRDELCYLQQNYVTLTRLSYLKEFIKYYTLLYYY